MTQRPQTPDIGPFLETFSRLESALQPSWLLPLRKAGIARFAELGFPTLQDEDWRFTNVAPLARLPLQPAAEPVNDAAAKAALEKYLFAQLPGARLVFVNGQYSMALSSVHGLPVGVRVSNLTAALVADSEFIKRQFSLYALANNNAFAALNQAFFADGGFVQVPAGVSVAEPIQFIFIATAKQDGETIQPRNLIVAGANSRATVIESYISSDNVAYFTNTITEIAAGDNAVLEHVKFQDEADAAFHLATIAAQLGRASNVSIHSFALGAKL
jgi:Fe-S cluster assembly protein SufD